MFGPCINSEILVGEMVGEIRSRISDSLRFAEIHDANPKSCDHASSTDTYKSPANRPLK